MLNWHIDLVSIWICEFESKLHLFDICAAIFGQLWSVLSICWISMVWVERMRWCFFFFLVKGFFFLVQDDCYLFGDDFFFLYPGGWLFFRRTVICLSVIAARNYVAYCSLPSGKMTHGGPLLFCTGSKEPSYTNSLTTTPPDLSKWHILLMAPASLTVWIEHRTRLLPWRFRFRHRRGKKSRVIKMCHHRCHY